MLRAWCTSPRVTLRDWSSKRRGAGGHALVGFVDDHAAEHAAHDGDQPLGLEDAQRFAQRRARHAEALDEVGLPPERVALRQLAAHDQGAQLVGDLLGLLARSCGLRRRHDASVFSMLRPARYPEAAVQPADGAGRGDRNVIIFARTRDEWQRRREWPWSSVTGPSTPTTTTTRRSTPAPATSTKEFRQRGVQVVQQGSHSLLLVGGKLFKFIPNPTFDPIIVAGCMDLMFRGQIPEGVDPRTLHEARAAAPRVPGPRRAPRGDGRAGPRGRADVPDARVRHRAGAARRHRGDDGHAPRVQPLARRGLGVLAPGPRSSGADAVARRSRRARSSSSSGCSNVAPRMVHLRPAPVPTANGTRPLVRPSRRTTRSGPASPRPSCRSPSTSATAATRCSPARGAPGTGSSRSAGRRRAGSSSCRTGPSTTRSAAWSSTVCSTATPRCAPRASRTAPTGCALLVKRLLKQANQTPWVFPESPLDTIREHVWVTPYYEEDMRKLADRIGVEQVLFGSDWPHGEGLADPPTSSRSCTPSPTTRSVS